MILTIVTSATNPRGFAFVKALEYVAQISGSLVLHRVHSHGRNEKQGPLFSKISYLTANDSWFRIPMAFGEKLPRSKY